MQLVTSVGAHSRGEHVDAFAVAGDLAVVEISPVKAAAAVVTVTVDPPLRCSSGSSIAVNVFGVSSWFFPSGLFHRSQSAIAGVA